MVKYKQILFDQLTPISIYTKLKERFHKELSFLFESAINSEEGNYSFIFIGAKERITYKDEQTFFTSLGADLMVVTAYGLILPKAILDSFN